MNSRLLLVLLLGLTLLASCSKQQAAAPTRPPVSVAAAAARQRDIPVQLRAVGVGEAYSNVSIKSQVNGPVMTVGFKEGQDVRKGDLLFSIDPRPFEAVVQRAEAMLARDRAQLDNAQAQEQRYAKLLAEGVIAKELYDQFRTSLETLQAAVRADEAALQQAKLDLSYCTIRSPIDGRTGSLSVYPGNLVKANDNPVLVVLLQVTPIYVTFSVPEQSLAEIKRRMAEGSLRVLAEINGEEQRPEEGVLTFVDNTVDASTGTIKLKATFANHARRLWPGQFVNVLLTLSVQRNAVVVPSEAVQSGQSGSYVFVVRSDMTAEARSVTPGRTADGLTVIEKGVQAGEQVVTDGQIKLVTGTRVEIKPATPGS